MQTKDIDESGRAVIGKRIAVILALLLVASGVVPTGAAAAVEQPSKQSVTVDTSPALQAANNSTADNSTVNTPPGAPSSASQVRITPAVPDADYVSVSVHKSDERFNTSGTFATFSLSEKVEAVRVTQPNAEARALGDGSVIQVEFASKAAPGDQQSLYTVEMFFDDGSKRSFSIMATNTDVSASPTINPEYSSVIDYLEQQAEGKGFEATPDGTLKYIKDREDKAQLFEGLWSEQIQRFVSLRIAQLFSPLDWVAAIVGIALLAYYLNRRHGWVLRIQQMGVSKAKLTREAIRQDAEEQRNAAAKHRLEDVDGIGTNATRYWTKMGIETVENMIQVACVGIVAPDEDGGPLTDEDGNTILAHQGIDDLAAVDPLTERNLRENTWLKDVILEGRLRAATALSHIEQALLVAEMDYNRGAEVRETRLKVQELLKQLQGRDDGTDAKYSTQGTLELPSGSEDQPDHPGGTPTGGDD